MNHLKHVWQIFLAAIVLTACGTVSASSWKADAELCGQHAVKENYHEVVKYCTISAAKGSLSGKYVLGRYHMSGLGGLPKDFEKGYALFKESADAGYEESMRALGYYYLEGYSDTGGDAEAVYWFKRGAELGDPQCQGVVGRMYYDGQLGQPKDVELARSWLSKAAWNGDGESMAILGLDLWQNAKQRLDKIEAVVWLIMSEDFGGNGEAYLSYLDLGQIKGAAALEEAKGIILARTPKILENVRNIQRVNLSR